jgi:nucleotide-binding universal stress UspA family protein
MPPLLRWAAARLPADAHAGARLAREQYESRSFLAGIERLLVAADDTPSGALASRLAGLLASVRRTPTTILQLRGDGAAAPDAGSQRRLLDTLRRALQWGRLHNGHAGGRGDVLSVRERAGRLRPPIVDEARKGFGLCIIGREPGVQGDGLHPLIKESADQFAGPFAVVLARGTHRNTALDPGLNILVPVTGTRLSMQGAEIALSLAQAAGGQVTALYVGAPGPRHGWTAWLGPRQPDVLPAADQAIVDELLAAAEYHGVALQVSVQRAAQPQRVVQRAIESGPHDLVIMGVNPRPGESLNLGGMAAMALRTTQCSLLLVSGEPSPGAATR